MEAILMNSTVTCSSYARRQYAIDTFYVAKLIQLRVSQKKKLHRRTDSTIIYLQLTRKYKALSLLPHAGAIMLVHCEYYMLGITPNI